MLVVILGTSGSNQFTYLDPSFMGASAATTTAFIIIINNILKPAQVSSIEAGRGLSAFITFILTSFIIIIITAQLSSFLHLASTTGPFISTGLVATVIILIIIIGPWVGHPLELIIILGLVAVVACLLLIIIIAILN